MFESFKVTTNEFPMTYLSGDLDVLPFILDAMISYFSWLAVPGIAYPTEFLLSSLNLDIGPSSTDISL